MAHAQLACYRGGMVLLMALNLTMHASAQSLPVGVYISVSGGIAQPATDSLTRVAAASDGFNREEYARYQDSAGPARSILVAASC